MDAFLNFMTGETTMYGYVVHNWIIALAGFVIIWVIVLVRDALVRITTVSIHEPAYFARTSMATPAFFSEGASSAPVDAFMANLLLSAGDDFKSRRSI